MSDTPRTDEMLRLHGEYHVIQLSRNLERDLTEAHKTIKRLRSLIPGCDCPLATDCWEPCGALGHEERYAFSYGQVMDAEKKEQSE